MAGPPEVPPKVLLLPLRRLPPSPPGEAPAQSSPALDHRGEQVVRTAASDTTKWLRAVRTSAEASILLDADGRLVAFSDTAASLLQLDHSTVGGLLTEVLELVDFTHRAAAPTDTEPPPMLGAITTRRLARALIRLRTSDGRCTTYDVISTPVAETGGSLSFLLPV